MNRRMTFRVAVLIPLLLSGFISVIAVGAELVQPDRSKREPQKVEKNANVRQTRKVPAKPDDKTTSLNDSAKRGAASSREQHDAAQKIIDNLK